jgi:hypothetical protein
MIPGDSAFTSLRYSSFTFGGIVGEFSSGEDMASLEGVYSEPKSCPTRLSDTPDLLAGNFRLGSWHRQLGISSHSNNRLYVLWVGDTKSFARFRSDPVERM